MGTRGYSRRYRSGRWRVRLLRHGRGPRVPCCRAQARTCPVLRAATIARRAPCGSRPRRRAAPRPPPRARPFRPWRPKLATHGAATSGPPTMRTSTPTRSALAPLTHSCCAPPSPPVRQLRSTMRARVHTSARAAALRACAYRTRAIVRVLRLFGVAEAARRGKELGEGIVRRGSDGGAVRCGRRLCVYVRRVLGATARFGMDGCT
jgi:hypothetical protein